MKSSSDDTFRALKDLPAKARMLCGIGLHRWSVWGDFSTDQFSSKHGYQNRVCIHCNLAQCRYIYVPTNAKSK